MRRRFALATIFVCLVTPLLHAQTCPAPAISVPAEVCPSFDANASVAPPGAGQSWSSIQWDITGGVFHIDAYPYTSATATTDTVRFAADGSGSVTLTVHVVDSLACPSQSSATVPLRSITAPAVTAPLELCPYGYGDVSVAPPSGGGAWQSINWDVTNGYFQSDQYPYQSPYASGSSNVRVYSNGQGPLSVHVRVADDQYCLAEATASVGVRSIAAPVITAPAEICPYSYGDVSVAPPPGGGAWQYVNWDVTNGYFQSDQYPYQSPYANGANVRVYSNGQGPTTVHVRVNDDQYCMNEATATIGVRAIAPPVITAPAEMCPYSYGDISVAPPPGGGAWQFVSWDVTNGYFQSDQYPYQSQWANGPNVRVYSNGQGPTTVHVRVNDDQYCSNEATATIGVRAIAPPVITAPAEICPYSYADVSVAPPPGGGAWQFVSWDVTNGYFQSDQYPYQSQWANGPNVRVYSNGQGPTTVHARVNDDQYCTNEATATIGVKAITPPAINAPSSICVGVNASASVAGTWNYVNWNITNGHFNTDSYPYTSQWAYTPSVVFVADGSGPVTLSAYVSDNEYCQASSTATVPITSPVPQISVGTLPIPVGSSDTAHVAGSFTTIQWTIVNGSIVSGGNSDTVTFQADGSGPITLGVTATDGTGCSGSNQAQFTIAGQPAVINAPASFCSTSVAKTASVFSNGTVTNIQWTITNGTISGGANATTVSFIPSSLADVTLTLDALVDGSPATATKVVLYLLPALNPSVSSETACASRTVTVTIPNYADFANITGHADHGFFTGPWNSDGNYYLIAENDTTPMSVTLQGHTADECVVTWTHTFLGPHVPQVTLSAPTLCGGTSQTATITNASQFTSGTFFWQITNGVFDTPLPPYGSQPSSVTFHATGTANVILWVSAHGANDDGCSAGKQIIVPVAPASAAPAISAGGPTTFCAGGSVTLTASSSASYLWSNGATSQSITVSTGGNYSVTVTDANGCSATSAATTVTVNPLPVATVTANGPTTFCAGGSVTLTASSGASYLWSNGAFTPSITVSASGNYSVTVTNASGCSATSSSTAVTVNPLPVATITANGATTFCAGGSVVLTASSAASYLWSNGATTPSITVSASGNYSVTVTDANECSATSSATTVTANPLPVATITANGPTTFCAGGSVTLTASSGASYLWSNGATTQSIAVSASGNYSVTVTNASGCSAASSATSVTVNPLPVATITANGPTTFCAGGSVTLTAPAGMSSYSWNNGATSQSIVVSAAGSYHVTVTDSNGCSATAADTVVSINTNPTPSITAPAAICNGASGNASTAAVSGATYSWTITGGTITAGAGTSAVTFTSTSGPVSLGVTVTDTNGCSGSGSSSVTVNALPSTTITPSGSTTFCAGGSVTLTAPAGMSSYSWNNGATSQSIVVSAAGSYHVAVTDANGCSATSADTVVAINNGPAPAITAPSAICNGASGNASTASVSGATYSWTISNGTITSGAGTSAITFTSTSGPVSLGVTVTDANVCSGSASATVTVNALPSATITAPAAICSGASGAASVAAVSGGSYAWTITGGTITSGAGTSAITFTSTTGPVSLGVTVTTSAGCNASSSKNVTVNALPNATITAPAAICNGASGAASVASVSGGSYAWTITGGTITGGSGTSAITFTSTTGPVSLGVTVTNANGCSATGNKSVTVNANPATPAISANGPTTFCIGGSVTLTAPASAGYHWSTGATTQSIVVMTSGSFTVSVTNASGCTSALSAPTTVTVNPATAITQQPFNVSIPKNTTTTLSVTATGTGTLSYQWYNPPTANNNDTSRPVGTNSPTYTTPKLSHGTYYYYVVVTGSCGAVRSSIATVTSN